MNISISTLLVAAIFLGGCASQPKYYCDSAKQPTTPESRYEIDRTNDTVLDKQTNLTWKICAEGQSFTYGNCSGHASGFDWNYVMQKLGGREAEWRLPSTDELKSLVEEQCKSPAMNLSVFPNTPPEIFWTATTDDINQDVAGHVDFLDGSTNYSNKSTTHRVRLVRGQKWVDPLRGLEEKEEHETRMADSLRIEELLIQEKQAELNARTVCNSRANCDKLFSLTKTFISQQSSKQIKIDTENYIETYNPSVVGDVGMTASRTSLTGNSAEIRILVSCLFFGNDALIEGLTLETEQAELLTSKMKKSKESCTSRKIISYRDYRSFLDQNYTERTNSNTK